MRFFLLCKTWGLKSQGDYSKWLCEMDFQCLLAKEGENAILNAICSW